MSCYSNGTLALTVVYKVLQGPAEKFPRGSQIIAREQHMEQNLMQCCDVIRLFPSLWD